MTPQVTLVGLNATIQRLRDTRGRAEESLRDETVRLSIQLSTHVKRDKLSGQVLKNRTGRLRRSINYRVEGEGSKLFGIVGTNVVYARAHEYGGPVTIRAHLRTITQAFGRKLKSPVTFEVRAHTVTYPERSFLRSALADMSTEIKQKLAQAMRKVLR